MRPYSPFLVPLHTYHISHYILIIILITYTMNGCPSYIYRMRQFTFLWTTQNSDSFQFSTIYIHHPNIPTISSCRHLFIICPCHLTDRRSIIIIIIIHACISKHHLPCVYYKSTPTKSPGPTLPKENNLVSCTRSINQSIAWS